MTQKEFFGSPKLAPLLALACILAWAGALRATLLYSGHHRCLRYLYH